MPVSVLSGPHLDGGQTLSHAVEERRYEHVRKSPPHHLDWRQEHQEALDHRHHQPDVDAAEHPEDQPEDERHGHGQQRGQEPVKDEFDQLEHGVASYPHSVEAVRGDGLRDDILKTHLQVRVDIVRIPVRRRRVRFPLL